MTFYDFSVFNELGVINIYKTNINIILLKPTKCQEQTVIAAINAVMKCAGERFHDKSVRKEQ